MTTPSLHIALLAGEASGDLLGAPLLQALRERLPHARFSGVGGPAMQAAGLHSLIDMERLSVMGLVEVLRHLPDILAAERALLAHWAADPPDVFIGIDAPDFNLRIARALHARGVRTVHYVSPSLWAWKEKRIHKIRRCIDLMLCLFPFETAVYDKHGVAAVCVGHPLRDRLRMVPAAEARAALGLPPQARILGLFPGSRRGEVRRLLPVFLETWQRLQAADPALQAVLSLRQPPDKASATLLATLPHVHRFDADSATLMAASDALLLASGTITLEAALLNRPMVVAYRVHPVSAALARALKLLKINRFSLPNLLAGADIVPECMQEECNPARLVAELTPLLADGEAAARQRAALAAVAAQLPPDVSARAADAIVHRFGW
ncbi:lipid-A-disaccharide synthase [Cardiobacterium valvarum]|uniref:Lipid-A-disaccharide synthase n=1 Tax=Cardiobacterium valvarum F0432 TaxID=797473 RepID=G9ZBB1_9GAMM|nr:lipid-A-disaccharide synthase [Cardiobacterium valvarum]EHM56128.1 lipid-A-disaccharide synthase [Cardiobacterium valvarum F0432]